jgi:transcriptional regulator with XRE-family HTH domain
MKQLIDDLVDAGFSQQRIGDAAGLSQATISRIRRGVNDTNSPPYRRLNAFHESHFSATHGRDGFPLLTFLPKPVALAEA